MKEVVYIFLMLWTLLGCLGSFTCASEVKEEKTDPSDSVENPAIVTPPSTSGDNVQGPQAATPDAASEGDDEASTSAGAAASPSMCMTGAESSGTLPESVAVVSEDETRAGAEQSGSPSKTLEEAAGDIPPTSSDETRSSSITVPPSTAFDPLMGAESPSNPRESVVSSASEASGRGSMAYASEDESSLSSADSAASTLTSLSLSWGDEERKHDDDLMSLMSFLLEGSEQEGAAAAEGAGKAESSGGKKAKGGKGDSGTAKTSKQKGLLKRVKGTFQMSPKKCKWDVFPKLKDRRHMLSQLCKAPAELRQVLRTPTMPLLKTRPSPPFVLGERSPDMLVLATFLKSAGVQSATARVSPSFSTFDGFTLPCRSATEGSTTLLELKRVASMDPLTFEVVHDGAEFALVAVPLHESTEKLKLDVATELMRVRSYLRARNYFHFNTGDELANNYHWNLLLDLFIVPKEKKYPINLPDGMKVVNYFALKKTMEMTLEVFVQAASYLEDTEPESVYVARASVSIQLLKLMSIYAQHGLILPLLSVGDFELSHEGVLYMSTTSPWYSAGKYYEVLDASRGFYVRTDEDKKEKADAQVVYFGEEMNTSSLVEILLAIWCGDEEKSRAVTEPDQERRHLIVRDLFESRKRESKCVPESLSALISKLLLQDSDSRIRISKATESPEWKRVEETLEQVMQFYITTKAE